ncbi:MAG TPA: PVC-type heme-binding CxxCH protein, partial [Gemmataceae bacterium]
WLYGLHGITAESRPGRPGTPEEERPRINCGVWRYHPYRKVFEVVCHGTTNPWGLDWDDHGEAFFTNCVIGHLWHVIPGAHYQRMYGTDYNRYAYELIAPTSDHLHWGGGDWTTSRGGEGIHSEAGGGHAHSGAMVYLGDNWPEKFRNHLFTCNLHGNRLNCDRLERQGCGYVGWHGPDVLTSDNPWFRGVRVTYGPDGAVYVTDWSDLGECHDNDGVHRSSGRIYRARYGETKPTRGLDLAGSSDAELVHLQLHKNDWYVRRARRLLAERAASGKPMAEVHRALRRMFDENPDVTRKLRAMWALFVTGGTDERWLTRQLDHPDEHVRSWAVRLLCDEREPGAATRRKFREMAQADGSGLVRLYLAAMLQRVPVGERLAIAGPLAAHAEDAGDRCQPLMIWYGIEPAVTRDRVAALKLAEEAQIPHLRYWVTRRIVEGSAENPEWLGEVVGALGGVNDADRLDPMLRGTIDGLKGRKRVAMPPSWPEAAERLAANPSAELRQRADLLGLLFGDERVAARLKERITDPGADPESRRAALQALVQVGVPGLGEILLTRLVNDAAMRGPAIRALAAGHDPRVPPTLLRLYPNLTADEKQDAIGTLAARPEYASALLDAVEAGRVPRRDVSAFTARQLMSLAGGKLPDRVRAVWGEVRKTPAEKKALIAKYQAALTPEVLARADLSRGRVLFQKTCMQCHKLFGEGGAIGPDLTGSDRSNLYYLLENAIDPGAVIGREYRLTNLELSSGRLLSGIIVEETDQALTVQTATERLVVSKADVQEQSVSPVSMMPEGQLEQLAAEEVRDLIAYLMSKRQVPLPGE